MAQIDYEDYLMRDGALITIIPAISAAIYADGDVLFVPKQLTDVARDTKGLATLRTLLVLDKADQKQAIDLLFFSRDPGDIGAANAPLAMSDAEAEFLLAHVRIAAGDYVSGNANAYATKQLELLMGCEQAKTDLWVAGVVRSGTPTYGSVDNLTFKFLWERL